MNPEQKRWFEEHGTSAEQQFVARYGDRKVSAGGLLYSVLFYMGFAALFFLVVGGYLYVSRASFLRPVTGTWVGMLADESDSGRETAVLLKTSINPLQVFHPTLVGSVRMCSGQAEQQFTTEHTRTVSADTLGVAIVSENPVESGRIFGSLREGELNTLYSGSLRTLQGRLRRGTQSEYQQGCKSLMK